MPRGATARILFVWARVKALLCVVDHVTELPTVSVSPVWVFSYVGVLVGICTCVSVYFVQACTCVACFLYFYDRSNAVPTSTVYS